MKMNDLQMATTEDLITELKNRSHTICIFMFTHKTTNEKDQEKGVAKWTWKADNIRSAINFVNCFLEYENQKGYE